MIQEINNIYHHCCGSFRNPVQTEGQISEEKGKREMFGTGNAKIFGLRRMWCELPRETGSLQAATF
jgi:hypothetical protein